MSIYEAEKTVLKLIDIHTHYGEDDIIASYTQGTEKNNLYFKEYTVQKLKTIVENYDTTIHFKFWNYDFCNLDNVNKLDIHNFTKNSTKPIYNKDYTFLGHVICTVYCYNILINVYTLDIEKFDDVFNGIIIDLNILRDFFITSQYIFPINANLLFLFKKIFTNDTIHKIIFKYRLEDIRVLLVDYQIEDFHRFTKYLYFSKHNYVKVLDSFVDNINDIDTESKILIKDYVFNTGFAFIKNLNFYFHSWDNLNEETQAYLKEQSVDKDIWESIRSGKPTNLNYRTLNYDDIINSSKFNFDNYLAVYQKLKNKNCCFDFEYIDISDQIIENVSNNLNYINQLLLKWK